MIDKVIFETKWMKLRQTEKGFIYSERKNKNSIAVLCYNKAGKILIRHQPLVVDGGDTTLYPCPITGSFDVEDENPIDVVLRELQEEAGYALDIESGRLESLGSYIVGTQTNERCFIYIADVSGLTPTIPVGDGGYHESISRNEWVPTDNMIEYEYSAFAHFIKRFYTLEQR